MNIFVAKLNYSTSSESLEELFNEYGTVSSCKIIMDRETGRSKGFGFVEMDDEDEALNAIASLNETEFEERTIVVKKANPPAKKSFGGPRGGGGGYQRREGGYRRDY